MNPNEVSAVDVLPRYVYVTPGLHDGAVAAGHDVVAMLRESLQASVSDSTGAVAGVEPVPWLPCGWFAALPPYASGCRIAKWPLHARGAVAGMDAASVVSVVALAPRAGEAVLDLCAAPGMKLGLIADAVSAGTIGGGKIGVAVGVDISMRRLYIARSCLRRRNVSNALLIHDDGAAFDPTKVDLAAHRLVPPKAWTRKLSHLERKLTTPPPFRDGATAAANLAAAAASRAPTVVHECGGLATVTTLSAEFDRVLVDAECTHDGSVLHLVIPGHAADGPPEEDGESTPLAAAGRALHADTPELHDLQRRLLLNGIARVKIGGVVVYSTCSFSEHQNERIVQYVLATLGDRVELLDPFAELEDSIADRAPKLPPMLQLDAEELKRLRERVTMTHPKRPDGADGMVNAPPVAHNGFTVRMTPARSGTSFQFVAKLRRLK
jgi:16S rRNA C967 or C1407 C5-methylase (RsmB/RsmF family)